MTHIAIIGAGFAGLTAIRTLRKLDKTLDITLISPKKELQFLPSTIWIPSGLRTREEVLIPLDNFLKRMNVQFKAAKVTGLKDGGRTIETDQGNVTSDGVIIASGGQFIKKLPGIEHAITPCEGVDAAEKIRDRLKDMMGGTIAIGFAGNPNEPTAMRGGPMFEYLFGIDTLLRQQNRRDAFKLVFFSPAEKPGNRLGEKAVEHLFKEMDKRGIERHLGHKMKGFEANKVKTEGGEFEANLILFMPGMTGNSWFDNSELPRSAGGLVQADQHCKVAGFDKVYVAGDSGSFPGPDWMPKQAHMADLQAEAAAKNLVAEIKGQPTNHTFKIELICIVDSSDKGMFIRRTESGSTLLPNLKLFHWAKRGFEKMYLQKYR